MSETKKKFHNSNVVGTNERTSINGNISCHVFRTNVLLDLYRFFRVFFVSLWSFIHSFHFIRFFFFLSLFSNNQIDTRVKSSPSSQKKYSKTRKVKGLHVNHVDWSFAHSIFQITPIIYLNNIPFFFPSINRSNRFWTTNWSTGIVQLLIMFDMCLHIYKHSVHHLLCSDSVLKVTASAAANRIYVRFRF